MKQSIHNNIDFNSKLMKKRMKKNKPEKHEINYVEYYLFKHDVTDELIEELELENEDGFYNPKIKRLKYMKELIDKAYNNEVFTLDEVELINLYYFGNAYKDKSIIDVSFEMFVSVSKAYELRRGIINKIAYLMK